MIYFHKTQGDIMKKVKITALKRAVHEDLILQYENPIANACDTVLGSVFISENGEKPEGLCSSAWDSMAYFVKELSRGGGNFYDGWMKNPFSAMISCNDGFRPVSFLLEALDD